MNHKFIDKIKNRIIITESGCWEWQGAKVRGGYGNMNVGGRSTQTHRLMYQATFGEIPNGMLVCHKCDNPPCCNPSHLFLGSNKTNAEDKVSKNRQARGDNNGLHKLTEAEVVCIKQLLSINTPHRTIAKMFGMGKTAISDINTGRSWKWVSV